MHTLSENYKYLSVLAPVAVTADTNHTGIDIEKYTKDGMVTVNVGAVTGTTPTLDLVIQGSEDGTNYSATAILTFGQFTTGSKVASGKINLNKYKKIRAVSDVGGTTPSFTLSIGLLAQSEDGASDLNSTTPA